MKHVFIIAEAGVNHNGSKKMAMQLCDAAKAAGVDAVKFQTWKTDKLLLKEAKLAEYQKTNTKGYASQYEMIKELELSYDEFLEIKKHCEEIGIEFLSTPDEEESLDFLVEKAELKLIKVGSGEVTNIPFLIRIGRKKLPVILSTGMSTLEEVRTAYKTLIDNGAIEVTLLHSTSNYPAPIDEVNLKAMETLRDEFNTKVGYSDHTKGITVAIAAAALGAKVIEKHFTLDKNLEGPDHKASLTPDELSAMVEAIRKVEKALGDGRKEPSQSELETRKVVFKSIVAAKPIKKGETLTFENLTAKRAGRGIDVKEWHNIIGRNAEKDYNPNDLI